jgi:hypothetical protein
VYAYLVSLFLLLLQCLCNHCATFYSVLHIASRSIGIGMRTFPQKYEGSHTDAPRRVASIRIVPNAHRNESAASTPRQEPAHLTTRFNHLQNACSSQEMTFRRPPSRINDGAGHDQVLCGGGPSVTQRGLRTHFAAAESPTTKTIRSTGTVGYTSVSRDYLMMTS